MASFEIIRYPLMFGSFLLAVGSAYIFREHFIPDFEEERKKLFEGDEKAKEILVTAMKSMK